MTRMLVNPSVTWSGPDGRLTQEAFNQIKDLHDVAVSLDERVSGLEATRFYPERSGNIATSSGTEHAFTAIPSDAEEVFIALDGVSLGGTDNILVQIGTGSGYVTSGYVARSSVLTNAVATVTSSAGFIVQAASASVSLSGLVRLLRASGTMWVADHSLDSGAGVVTGAGMVDLGGEIGRIRIIASGSDSFDAGSILVGYR